MVRESGKQRSQRIEIDYYRKPTDLYRLRTWCIAIGLIGSGIYAAYVIASGGGGASTSTGPVATSHASFENDCKQCHENFTPIDSRGVEIQWSLVGLDSAENLSHMESACQKCHQVGDHYRDVMTADWKLKDQNCASCHADHKGRDNDLTLVAAHQCTSCHSNLAEGCSGKPSVNSSVTAFTKEQHGEFASLGKGDPGKVKFDHHQHMRPGQVDQGIKGQFTLAMMDPSERARYRQPGQDDAAAVQLQCSNCHVMSGNPDANDSLITDGELGRYIEPISFEQHCAACHSMNPGVATADTTPLPHAVEWNKIDLLLEASLAGSRLTSQARVPRDDRQANPQPGEGLGAASAAGSLVNSAEIQEARKRVEAECLECHDNASITDEAILAAREGTSPPMIPGRWFQRGLYDHGAHRKIDCVYCHAAADPNHSQPSGAADHETVMIDGIDSCTGCHRDSQSPTPASLTGDDVASFIDGQPTWASDNCTLCHRYHTAAKQNEGGEKASVTVAKSEDAP